MAVSLTVLWLSLSELFLKMIYFEQIRRKMKKQNEYIIHRKLFMDFAERTGTIWPVLCLSFKWEERE
jgi:hypothetical protein